MYQALYRKYRPRTFDDVAGQEHITKTLINQIQTGRASHAYLFVGTRGTGKTTCAKILARAVNCENPVDGNPCNECPACLSIESGQASDVLEIDAASNNGVDNVRALRDEAIFSPASTKLRVYIIDEVHMLSGSAFNALLKILEDPPEHLLFILATTELHKVPATVISRCQRFSFRRLPREVITERLIKIAANESISLDYDAAELLSRLSDGSMRDAISLFDQCSSSCINAETMINTGICPVDISSVRDILGLPAQGEAYKLLAAITNRDAKAAFTLFDTLYAAGKQPASLFDELCELTRDALVATLIPGADNLLSGALSKNELKSLAKVLPPARLTHILSVLTKTEFSRGSGDKLTAEICLASLCDERLDTWPEALVSRLEALEAGGFTPQSISAPQIIEDAQPVTEPEPETEVSFDLVDENELPPWDMPVPARELTSEPELLIEPTCEPELEPEPEQEPEITIGLDIFADTEPEVKAKPEAVETTGSQQETGIWQQILSALPPSMSAAILNTTAALEGNMLLVSARDTFTFNFLSSEKPDKAIRETAAKLLGHEISLRAELSGEQPDAQIKLDDLSQRFGGLIKYE